MKGFFLKTKLISAFMIVCSCHVTYVFQSESTLYSCLDVKGLLSQNRREIWSLSDCHWTRTQNHSVRKRTLNHLAKLAKLLSVRLQSKWFWVRVQLQLLWLLLIFASSAVSTVVLFTGIFTDFVWCISVLKEEKIRTSCNLFLFCFVHFKCYCFCL